MKNERAQGTALGIVAVLVPGAAAAAVLGRAFTYYQGRDSMAGFIVALMAVGLAVGLVELFARVRRAAALHAELAALPDAPTEADIERTSPPLRAVLRARLEHAPMPAMGESLTGYLVGLMVMLGLLGTLLGLFETLGGAGRALTASTNVEALRSGLSGPMLGLTRSFGCSAAGVAASAMLGLASVLVKRRELTLVGALQRYAAGALRELSPLRRQLQALEQLAAQGAALPEAAAALTLVGGRIDALSERWESTLVRTSQAQEEVIRSAFGGLRERVESAAAAAASSLEKQLAPVLRSSVESTERAAREHLDALRKALALDLARRSEAESAAAARSGEALTSLADKLAASLRAQTEEAQGGFSRLFSALNTRDEEHRSTLLTQRSEAAAHVAALGDAARALLSQLDGEARARREEAGKLLGELAEKLDAASRERAAQSRDELSAIAALGERIAGDVDTREKARSAAWTELAQRVVEMAASTRSEEEARLLRLDNLAARIGGDLGQLSSAMEKQLETRMDAEEALATRSRDAMALIEQNAHALEGTFKEQKAALDMLLAASADSLADVSVKAQSGAASALTHIMAVADAQGERFAALSAQISDGQTQQTEGLAAELTAHAERLTVSLAAQAEKLTAALGAQADKLTSEVSAQTERMTTRTSDTGKLVEDAAQLLKASGVEMSAVAEMFGKSVERQRETAKTWLESLGELEGAIERVGRGAAADALGDQLASTHEVFARQLQFQRELFEQLRSLRGAAPTARGDLDVSA